MTPGQLFNNPRSDLTQAALSEALELHIKTGESIDVLLGLKSEGFSQVSPRLSYLRQRRGALLVCLWKLLQFHGKRPT